MNPLSTPLTMRQAAKIAWANECLGWAAMGTAGTPNAFQIEDLDGLVLAWWLGEPFSVDHYLLVPPDYTGDLDGALHRLAPRLRQSGTPLVLRWLMEAEAPEWRLAAEAHGCIQTSSDTLMTASLYPGYAHLPPPPGVHSGPASSAEYLEALAVIQQVFGGPPALTQFFSPPGVTHLYLALWNGKPACAATLWPFANAAGVYSVATLPVMRGHGMASALIGKILSDAAANGTTLACLRCADPLVPLYSRCGFRPVGRVLTFYHHR